LQRTHSGARPEKPAVALTWCSPVQTAKRPAHLAVVGASRRCSYFVVDDAAAVDFLAFLLCFLAAGFEAVEEDVPAAGASAAMVAADFGISAAIAPAAMPTDSNAEAISLIMGSPAVCYRANQRIRRITSFGPR